MTHVQTRVPRRRGGMFGGGGALVALVLLLAAAGCDRGSSGEGDPLRAGALEGRIRWVAPVASDGGESAPAGEEAGGRSLAGVSVVLAGTDRVARTDSAGRFRFNGLEPGAYELMIEAAAGEEPAVFGPFAVRPGQGTTTGELAVADAEAVRHGASLAGEAGFVVAPEEPGARVEITVVAGGTARVVRVEADGVFLVEKLPLGAATVYARGPAGWEMLTRTVDLGPGLNTLAEPLVLAPLDPARTAVAMDAADRSLGIARTEATAAEAGQEGILGTLLLDIPAALRPGAWAATTVQLDTPTPSLAGLDDRGSFRFPSVGPGVYHVTLDSPLLELPEPVRVEVGARQNTVIVLYARYLGEVPAGLRGAPVAAEAVATPAAGEAGATLRGRLAVEDEQALAGARVALAGTSLAAVPGRDGAFVLAGIPAPGRYDLVASAPGHKPFGPAPVELPGAGTFDAGVLRLELDVKRPRVVGATPRDGARDVVVDYVVPVTITFDQPMDAASVKGAVSITPPVSFRALMGRDAPETDDRTLLLELDGVQASPTVGFNQRYTVSVAATARNLEGIAMEAPFTTRFATAKASLVDSFPKDGANGVLLSVNEALIVYANAPIDAASVDDRLVRVRPNRSGSAAIVRATTDAATGWGILEVRYPFEENTDYTVTLSGRLRTTSRTSFANLPYTIRFRTGEVRTQGMDAVASDGRRDRRDPDARAERLRGRDR